MGKEVSRTITACCSDSGAALKVSFDAATITAAVRKNLQGRLLKKGIDVQWSEQESNPELLIRIVEMNQGNQFLRYLLPFIAPARLEVEGQVALAGSMPEQIHYVQRAQVGLFGGSGQSMLKTCAERVAKNIASDVLRHLKS
jgi:hypothetical protein